MRTSKLLPRAAAAILVAAVCATATVPIQTLHAHRGGNVTKRLPPSTTTVSNTRAGDLPSNRRTKLRAGATAVSTAKPVALAAQVKRRKVNVSIVRFVKPALGGVITALAGALTAASAYVSGSAIEQAVTSSDPILYVAAGVVTGVFALLSGLMTVSMGESTIDLTRDALR